MENRLFSTCILPTDGYPYGYYPLTSEGFYTLLTACEHAHFVFLQTIFEANLSSPSYC